MTKDNPHTELETLVERVALALSGKAQDDWERSKVRDDWRGLARAALEAAGVQSLLTKLEGLERDKSELTLMDNALGVAIETALGTPGGKTGGYPARIVALRTKLEGLTEALRTYRNVYGVLTDDDRQRIDAALAEFTQ